MALKNKLNITDSVELAHAEEKLSKAAALQLFDDGLLDTFEVGSFAGLALIHRHLFGAVYDFAGELRTVDLAKGKFCFAPVMYQKATLANIEKMAQGTFDEIIEKYIEMNIAHPFRDGNGRSTRIWLDMMLRESLGRVVDWSKVGKEEYLSAMEQSPVRDDAIKGLLKSALTNQIADREMNMMCIDASWNYEGFNTFKMKTSEEYLLTVYEGE